MAVEIITVIGLAAGAITSIGFVPQIIRGYRTKKLDDVSYYMPLVLLAGLSLWLIYGIAIADIPITVANITGVTCNAILLALKKKYDKN